MAGTIAVQHSLVELGGQLILSGPKTMQGRRKVELPHMATKAQQRHQKAMKGEGQAGPYVFCGTGGGPIRRSNLRNRGYKRLLKQAGLQIIRFHDLRQTVATLLLSQGIHPNVVQERLGHSQFSLTLDTNSHVHSACSERLLSDQIFCFAMKSRKS